MLRLHRALLRLGVLWVITSLCTFGGCTSMDGQATPDDLNNKAFTFSNGAVFHPALANVATTLEFTEKAGTFTLTSVRGTARGLTRFGSCILMLSSSDYPAGAGPQMNEVITFNPCDYSDATRTLTVTNGATTATSQPALARVVNATAADLNNRTFLFASGAVFQSALANLATTIRFTNNATAFTLSSTNTNNATNTARGNNRFDASGACILTVTSSDYPAGAGPQITNEMTLRTCQFNSSTGFLILSSDGIAPISSL